MPRMADQRQKNNLREEPGANRSAGVSPAVARASCPRAGAGRSRHRGRDSRATVYDIRPVLTQLPPLPSRLVVIFTASPRARGFRFVFAKCGVLCFFSAQIALKMRSKRANNAASKIATSFVFKYFLASFPLFSIFCNFLHFPIGRTIPSSSGVRQSRRSPATICPPHDHNYRLSCGPGLVKRKMRAGGQVSRWAGRQMGRQIVMRTSGP